MKRSRCRIPFRGRAGILMLIWYSSMYATNYEVGPGLAYETLQDVTDLLNPGDTAFVAGNATYPPDVYLDRSGTPEQPIVLLGITPAGGTRPLIEEAGSYGIQIASDNIVVEGFEVAGQPKGIGVFGNNITVRGTLIRDCNHGLIGYGTGTGNVTVEYCEFYGNGIPTGGATQHQIYMATDEESHPGAVFRLQFSYLHDAVEGDNVKSRSERNEIYYNWVENAGSGGHGLGLFAPDPEDNSNVDIGTATEDADVVGNVIIQARNSCARIGGDAPGYPTDGRYRFVNNTFIFSGTRGDAIRTFNRLETLEMSNNVIFALQSSGDFRVLNDADGEWLHSPRSVAGSHNWVMEGATQIPGAGEWANTLTGSQSPFENAAGFDFVPASGGPLENAGTADPPSHVEYPFEVPQFPPEFIPPTRKLLEAGLAAPRSAQGALDIGAYEVGGGAATRPGGEKTKPKGKMALKGNFLKIQLPTLVSKTIFLALYNSRGEKILSQRLDTSQNFVLPLPSLAPGLYFAKINSRNYNEVMVGVLFP